MSARSTRRTRSERPLCLPNRSDLTRTIGDRTLACCRMSSSRTYSLFTMTNSVTHRRLGDNQQNLTFPGFWWSQTGSNRRPEACKATALPTELWPHFLKGSRATGRGGRSALRAYRLEDHSLVGLGGLEPPTSRLSSARSNQLSYRPEAHDLEDTLSVRPKT